MKCIEFAAHRTTAIGRFLPVRLLKSTRSERQVLVRAVVQIEAIEKSLVSGWFTSHSRRYSKRAVDGG